MATISKKYDFSLFFDVQNGNPNGDPDSGNMPRMDAETGRGLVTDVCLKRKIRNYVALAKEGEPGYGMYISGEHSLNKADLDALIECGVLPANTPSDKGKVEKALKDLKKSDPEKVAQLVKEAACAVYFDVRAFGAVMTSYQTVGSAQVRGPVQLGFAQSIDPIIQQEVTITRCAHATEQDRAEKEGSGTMGRKYVVPYGLYRVDGYISAALAEKYSKLSGEKDPDKGAGFSEDDLELFWDALMNMFEHDRSSARGNMAVRKLVIFTHNSKMGNAPSHKLFDTIICRKRAGVDAPRSFDDYEFGVDVASAQRMGVMVEIRD